MTVKLLPEVKKMWVDALRSGRYKQGHEDLIDGVGGHCCLGVLVAELGCGMARTATYASVLIPSEDVAVESHGALPAALFKLIYGYTFETFGGNQKTEHHRNPRVRVNFSDEDSVGDVMLSELNDGYMWSFEQIADIIEEQL